MKITLADQWSNKDFLGLSENFEDAESFWGYVADIEDELPRLHDSMIKSFIDSLKRVGVADPDIVYWGGTPMSAQYALQALQRLSEQGLLTENWMESDKFTKPKAVSILTPLFTSLTPEPDFIRYFNYKYFPGYKKFWKASEGDWDKPKKVRPEKGESRVLEIADKLVSEEVQIDEPEETNELPKTEEPEVPEDRAYNTGKLWAEDYVSKASPEEIQSYTDDQLKQVFEYGQELYPDDEGFQNYESFAKGFKEVLQGSDTKQFNQSYNYGYANSTGESAEDLWNRLRTHHKDSIPTYLKEEYFDDFKRGVEDALSEESPETFSDEEIKSIAEETNVSEEIVRKWIEEGKIS